MSEPVLWHLGLFEIRWHDFWHLLSLTASLTGATLYARRCCLPWPLWRDALLWTLPEALLAARLGYVLTHLDLYLLAPLQVWQLWDGGYALGAGVAAGLLAGWRFSRVRHLAPAPLAAAGALGLALWQLGLALPGAASTRPALTVWSLLAPSAVLLTAAVGARRPCTQVALLPLWLALQAGSALGAAPAGDGAPERWGPPLGWVALLALAALLLRAGSTPAASSPPSNR